MTSMLEYLASLRRHGHTPEYIGHVTIGRTVYTVGRFTSRELPERDGVIPAETRLALMPVYRTDWAAKGDMRTPEVLPASYKRRAMYVIDGQEWFISGWNDDMFWLLPIGGHPEIFTHDRTGKPYRRIAIYIEWKESFDTAMKLAGPDVLTQIESANNGN